LRQVTTHEISTIPAFFPHESVRTIVTNAWGELGDPRAVEPPIQLLKEGLFDERQQAAILESLVKLGEPALLPLFEALKDQNKNVRRNAVEALNKFGDARAIAPLTSVLYDRDPNIGYAARDAIESIRNRNLL